MKRVFFIFFLLAPIICGRPCFAAETACQVHPQIAWQGKTLAVKVPAEDVASVSGIFLGQKFLCYKKGDVYKGIIGVPLDQKPGYYKLKLFITRTDGAKETRIKQLKVWSTRFPYSKFWLPPARNKLRARQIVNNEWALIDKVLRQEATAQRWQGKFIDPVTGEVSQGFGHKQIINGKAAGSHRGVDYTVISGTEVIAPNNGKIVFADRLQAFGGTMVLDHGQGIHTLYFHLSKMIAPVGQEVKKGQVIALSGNSGVSSGAHLHWGMSVHNLRVDPKQWVKYDI
ncbi:MAG: M23 family metallopeptidase [Candidatus Saganbacteria bacterium]|nr:M23 family metallopeptidase [Candidatus Saganbacteria bacterium]